jgi:hypothetical protein
MMSSKQLATALVVCALFVVAVVAVVDAARSRDAVDPPADPPPTTGREDAGSAPADELEAQAIRGILYYSDPEDDCRVHALALPTLEAAPPSELRACRFELPPEPGTGTVDGDDSSTARKPDGTLTVIRKGEVWNTPCARSDAAGCGQRLLATAELTEAAHAVPFVPTGPRHLRSVMAIRVAWFNETRAAVLVRVRLRGRLRVLGPVAVLAVYEGARLVRATQYAGAFDLRMSPQRSFVGVVETGRRVTIVSRSGTQVLGAADLPSPSAHAVAWSPDERWVAVASRWSVYLLRMADLAADRQPRIIRLPLVARDLAWR